MSMKALHRVEYPLVKDQTPQQKTFNAENQRFLNANFQMIQEEVVLVDAFIDSMADYVVAQGLSGSWFYREWYSGKVEAWGKTLSDTAAITTADGSLYKAEKEITFPTLFSTVDCVTASVVSTTPVMSNIKSYDATKATMHLLSATSTTATLTFFVHIIGRL